jgi:hypothetical protein
LNSSRSLVNSMNATSLIDKSCIIDVDFSRFDKTLINFFPWIWLWEMIDHVVEILCFFHWIPAFFLHYSNKRIMSLDDLLKIDCLQFFLHEFRPLFDFRFSPLHIYWIRINFRNIETTKHSVDQIWERFSKLIGIAFA